MHHKNIKAIVRKQLKINYRHWNLLNKKAKKRIARMVLEEVKKDYDFGNEIKASEPELLGIEYQLPTPGIMNLEEMESFISSHKNDVLFKLKKHKKHPLIGKNSACEKLKKYSSMGIHGSISLNYESKKKMKRKVESEYTHEISKILDCLFEKYWIDF